MENVFAELWPYFLLLYCIDGIKYLGTDEIGLSSYLSMKGPFRITSPGSFFLNLLPGGLLIRIEQRPIILTKDSLYFLREKKAAFLAATPSDFMQIPYEKIETLSSDGKDILFNGKKYLETASNVKTVFLVKSIRQILNTKKAKRKRVIQTFYDKRMDINLAQADWQHNQEMLLFVSPLCQLLFIALFILLPVRLYTETLSFLALEPLLLAIFANFMVVIGVMGYALRDIYKLSPSKVAIELLLHCISPLSAPQALLHLTLNLFYQYDWLVIVALLGPENRFHHYVRQRFHYIQKMKDNTDDPAWADFWHQEAERVTELVEQSGSSIEIIYQRPLQQDLSSTSYCSVCHSEYRLGYDICYDCDTILQSFSS